ncbi:Protein-glutamate methylesterase/protein-glutamine glutaminase [Streptomyces antimycoticus]
MVLSAESDMEVVAEAADGASALSLARETRPDVCLVDIRMPPPDGLEVTRRLAGSGHPGAPKVVVVTTFDLDEYVYTALSNGASGFLLKDAGPALLTEAVRASHPRGRHGRPADHPPSAAALHQGAATRRVRADRSADRRTRSAGPDECSMDTSTADQGGYQVGDTVRLAVDGPVLHKRLVGIVRTDDTSGSGGTSVFFDDATAQKLLLKPGQYDGVSLEAERGTSEERLAAEARDLLPDDSEISTGAQLRAQQQAEAAEGAEGLSQVLLVFAAIALFVGVFVIGNTFTMLVTQRSQEMALMRAVGAGRRQVTRSVLIEAALLGLCAGAAGFLLGIGVAMGLRQLFASTGSGFPDGPLVIAPGTVLVSFLVGVVVTMLAAYLPARRAAAVPPVAAMSALHTRPPIRSLRRRNAIGVALIVIGVLGVLYTASSGGRGRPPSSSRPFCCSSASSW